MTGEEIQLPNVKVVQLADDGYYTLSDEQILSFTDFAGKETPLLANFNADADLLQVHGDVVYFRTNRLRYINRYDYWKIKKDGTGLTQLNT